jgi:hypothetical protein
MKTTLSIISRMAGASAIFSPGLALWLAACSTAGIAGRAQAQAPPPNDDITNASPLVFFPETNIVNTSTATHAASDPSDCVRFGPDVWFSFTPTQDVFLQFHTLSGGFAGALAGYEGAPGALTPLFCFGGGDWGIPALAGNTYYFLVGTDYGTDLQYAFLVYELPRLKISVSVDPTAALEPRTGLVTVTGAVTSSEPVTIGLYGALRQKLGRKSIVTGEFGSQLSPIFVTFSGQATWSVQVVGDTASFSGGAALLSISAGAGDGLQSVATQATDTIQLKASKK